MSHCILANSTERPSEQSALPSLRCGLLLPRQLPNNFTGLGSSLGVALLQALLAGADIRLRWLPSYLHDLLASLGAKDEVLGALQRGHLPRRGCSTCYSSKFKVVATRQCGDAFAGQAELLLSFRGSDSQSFLEQRGRRVNVDGCCLRSACEAL